MKRVADPCSSKSPYRRVFVTVTPNYWESEDGLTHEWWDDVTVSVDGGKVGQYRNTQFARTTVPVGVLGALGFNACTYRTPQGETEAQFEGSGPRVCITEQPSEWDLCQQPVRLAYDVRADSGLCFKFSVACPGGQIPEEEVFSQLLQGLGYEFQGSLT